MVPEMNAAIPRRGLTPSGWVALAGGAALLAPTLVHPAGSGPILCPFRRLTGVWCPGCGMTRSLGWLAHGDLAESWRYHPWGILLAVQVALFGALWAWRRTRPPARARAVNPNVVSAVLVANTVAMTLIWILRLKSGAFDGLA